MLLRLIDNLSGFVYRRRHDAGWTMEFVSQGCRDVTGYDPHRFVGNASLAFADLIAPRDRARVFAIVDAAISTGRRAVLTYRIRAAHGGWVLVEDRFAPVRSTSGDTVAIEGYVDRVRSPGRRTGARSMVRWMLPPRRPAPQRRKRSRLA